ncbi:response regulator [Acaryochloris sp. 'Moss Beach']|uniref:response regulator n=1 Tax=Acaryochloris sp. 'Moss Beach' TaxID=2740837 RepID=UPI001F30202C|nr:response regulator [Acaryochloris sp. 'Moss Beach']UJB67970.1 response regulator [Acaryochloris sp. 'Moss Beach']
MLQTNCLHLGKQEAMTAFDTGVKKSTAETLRDLIHAYPSGRVLIRDPSDLSIGWRVSFSQGRVNFAESIVGNQERLSYLLQRCMPQFEGSHPQESVSDYSFLCHLWQADYISHDQLRDLLTAITQEALIHALAIPHAQYQFEANIQIDPILLCMSLWDLVLPVEQTINQWTLLSAEIQSPFSRPYITDADKFAEYADYVSESLPHLDHLTHALEQEQCLYQLAHNLSVKVGDLAISLHPLIKLGALGVNPYHMGEVLTRPRVACINQSKLTQRYVTQVLEPSGYDVMRLSDSIRALPALLKRPPVLALVDAELPHLDGYQLCRMVHRRDALRELPVIIMAPQRGMCDLIRSRLSGAMACLGKPFHHQELLALVQKAAAALPVDQQQQLHSLPVLEAQSDSKALIKV